MKDRMAGERGEYLKSWPTYWFWFSVYIRLCVCECVCFSVYPHGNFAAADCEFDRLLSRCFSPPVFLYLLHLCSLSEKVYPPGPI